jgi:hypothetical protein
MQRRAEQTSHCSGGARSGGHGGGLRRRLQFDFVRERAHIEQDLARCDARSA